MKQSQVPKCTNLLQATPNELVWLRDHRCNKHGHRYSSHFGCFLTDMQKKLRIGFLDIESQGSLDAIWGMTITYSIKPRGKKSILRKIDFKHVTNPKIQDKRLLRQFCKDVKNFDVLVVYYGCDKPGRHDFPFLRARAEKWGIKDFPKKGQFEIVDLYDLVKKYFKYPRGRRRLGLVCGNLGIPAKQTPMKPDTWRAAGAGKKWAIDEIGKHNKEDVESTEMLFDRIIEYHTLKFT